MSQTVLREHYSEKSLTEKKKKKVTVHSLPLHACRMPASSACRETAGHALMSQHKTEDNFCMDQKQLHAAFSAGSICGEGAGGLAMFS